MTFPSPQPNDFSSYPLLNPSPRFWGLVIVTGIGTGTGAGMLMKPLRARQHLSCSYPAGARLNAEPGGELPVMDHATGGVLGIAIRP